MIERSDSKWAFLTTVSILGQPPCTPSMLYRRVEEVEKWSAARRAKGGLAGLI